MNVWDLRLAAGKRSELPVPDGYTTALVVLRGAVRVGESEAMGAAEVGLFDRAGKDVTVGCDQDATALLLAGEPIDERIVGSGPFVMNSPVEIRQAIADYQSGRMGRLA
ncbi:MAG TPA: pirin-like C-terminal cupin domain-containing protein [Candidatus Eisenbacteria bacterium]|nr:pirin-like C-terminal cupin domain-containing protein [Candidatus Eisenbacteria bacterium]